LKKLRNRFNRFCYQNRHKGIPNLMLYITLGSALVYVMSMFDRSQILYYLLCFDRRLILQGQIWRLFTYVFTYSTGNLLTMAISLICYFSLGRAMENAWGTLRFNLFYLTGVVLMDIFCMLFGGAASVTYLNLSLLIGFATLYPDTHFLLFFIIPVKAWILAMFYLGVTLYNVVMLSLMGNIPYNLYPLISIANYFLFFGKDVLNIIPMSWQLNARRLFKKKPAKKTGTIPFPTAGSYAATIAKPTEPYNHRCEVCGRTDVSHPDLEFRYCSRCKGYHCYCEDHINSHTHVE